MTVENIVKSVRLCIDEETDNGSSLADASLNDETKMDSIIKDKIGDALRWVCLYAPSELLIGSDESGTSPGIIYEGAITPTQDITDADAGIEDGAPAEITNNHFVLPANFIKLVRVRATGWHRAIHVPLSEDSDEYLQLHDPTCAYATADRPQAVLINKARKELEIWPSPSSGGSVEFTCIVSPTSVEVSPTTTNVAIPPLAKAGFIYYLAFLLLSAYGDARAPRMLEIAQMNLSSAEKKV